MSRSLRSLDVLLFHNRFTTDLALFPDVWPLISTQNGLAFCVCLQKNAVFRRKKPSFSQQFHAQHKTDSFSTARLLLAAMETSAT